MKLIVLKGDENTGKTTTINWVCNDLRGQGYIEETSSQIFEYLGNGDFLTVLQKGEVKIGIISQGDYPNYVESFLEKLENKKCSIVICAQTIGEGKEEIQKTIDKYSEKEIVSISKTKGYKKIAQEINDKVTEILDCLEKLSKNL
jgi:hypothetical protein